MNRSGGVSQPQAISMPAAGGSATECETLLIFSLGGSIGSWLETVYNTTIPSRIADINAGQFSPPRPRNHAERFSTGHLERVLASRGRRLFGSGV
jgi:hypothetical protein